jgi:hypothetical protein
MDLNIIRTFLIRKGMCGGAGIVADSDLNARFEPEKRGPYKTLNIYEGFFNAVEKV